MTTSQPTKPEVTTLPLGWTHETSDVPPSGLAVQRQADAAERAALAAALGILCCEALKATYRVRRTAGDGYRLTGRAVADVQQACVITLAPVHETVDVPLEADFVPANLASAQGGTVDLEGESEIEPFDGTTLHVGRVVFEEIAASLNPYPRRPGAEYQPPESPAAKDNPFAVLSRLKEEKP